MKCARLNLQERSKSKPRAVNAAAEPDRSRRFCQRRLVDPGHDEDPRWSQGFMDRFRCNDYDEDHNPQDSCADNHFNHNPSEDMFLSVQTLQFQGGSQERKPPRTCFKYKALAHGNRHRMFVKEVVEDQENVDEDCTSQQNSISLDDYIKYVMSSDRSRPSTGKSSLILRDDFKEPKDKAVQVDIKRSNLKNKELNKNKPPIKKSVKLEDKEPQIVAKDSMSSTIDEAKISYHTSGKRKSITISRAQSPETVQVIRVDVVCNYSNASSTISDFDVKKKQNKLENSSTNDTKSTDPHPRVKSTSYANKYLLTKTVKSLEENVPGGAKVTLLCKTYRLSDRVRASRDNRKLVHPVKTKTFGFRSKANVLK